MTLKVSSMLESLDSFHGREFETAFSRKKFILLFHDTTKLRIRTEQRDLSVPISILMLGIAQLLARREFNRAMCHEILGKEWGYQFIARLLLECDDVCLKAGVRELALVRVRRENGRNGKIRPPHDGSRSTVRTAERPELLESGADTRR